MRRKHHVQKLIHCLQLTDGLELSDIRVTGTQRPDAESDNETGVESQFDTASSSFSSAGLSVVIPLPSSNQHLSSSEVGAKFREEHMNQELADHNMEDLHPSDEAEVGNNTGFQESATINSAGCFRVDSGRPGGASSRNAVALVRVDTTEAKRSPNVPDSTDHPDEPVTLSGVPQGKEAALFDATINDELPAGTKFSNNDHV